MTVSLDRRKAFFKGFYYMNRFKKIFRDDIWVIILDIVAVNLSFYLALILRSLIGQNVYNGNNSFGGFFSVFYRLAPWYTILCLIVFFIFKLYGGLWRYAGINDLNRIIGASLVTLAIQVVGSLIIGKNSPYPHMPFIYYSLGIVLQFLFVAAIRFSYRIIVIEKRRNSNKAGNALVIGIGELGRQTAQVLHEGVYFNVGCVVDVENKSAGKFLDGIPIYGKDQFEEALSRHDITCVFLAEPGVKAETRRKIKDTCSKNSIEFRDYTSFFDFVGESDQFSEMQKVVNGPEHESGKKSIPFSPPDISESEIGEVVEALKSGWITTGPRTKLLERRLAAYIETGRTDIDTENEVDRWKERVVCLNSATAAEELNLRIFGVREGDEVIVPAYTYTASASAAIHCGAKIVFVDIQKDGDPVTHMPEMDYDALEAAITEKTKAVIVVDLGGIVADYDRIYDIVERKRGLFRALESDGTPLGNLSSRIQHAIGRVAVVADCAHSLGASRVVYGEKKYCGAIADFTSFSFHAVKNFTTAEGGASSWKQIPGVDNSEIYRFYQLLSLHGQSKDALAKTKIGAWEYDIIGPWYKCNMTDIMAAIGLRQLDRYLGLLRRREQIMKVYDKTCEELGISHMIHHVDGMDSSNHLYLIRIPGIDVETRNLIIEKMAERGVATNVHYKPLPMMTAYGQECSVYPNSYDYYHNLITLPLHTLLSDEDVEYVCENLKEVFMEHRG